MIAAFDVHYLDDGRAQVAAVIFDSFSDAQPRRIYRKIIDRVEAYVPGSFYKRELPCILGLLAEIEEPIDTIIIDGYVTLGDHPGLGKHLNQSLGPGIAIIGVAKKHFKGSKPAAVTRGRSKRPLFVTSSGIELEEAKILIESMHGGFRIPTLLKAVDRFSRIRDIPNTSSS